MHVTFGVLGAVAAWDAEQRPLALKGPRHRAVLARLIVARRQVVPVARLVADLWEEPPKDATGTVRTFVAALRRAVEPDRPPRTPPRLLVTEGPGYALRAGAGDVDAWQFEQAVDAVTDAAPPATALGLLTEALDRWRGPAYADFADAPWARTERTRLTQLRLHAVELRAEAQLALGAPAQAVADLDAHAGEHPWREEAWRLLALGLYRAGRQADALSVLRRARTLLKEQLGVDPGPRLRHLEEDVLRQADHLDPGAHGSAAQVWTRATTAYESNVAPRARIQLESSVGLLRDLAVTGGGGLMTARRHRLAAVAAAEELGDPELTARVIGRYDVPALWTRSDDPEQSRLLVGAAERTLRRLPSDGAAAARCRLLATIAVESRGMLPTDGTNCPAGTTSSRPLQAARQAEALARELDDAALLAFALNGTFMQSFHRAGLAPRRDAVGAEIVALSVRHDLPRYEVLGHLIRVQGRAALADLAGADRHAAAADALAARHDLPLVAVFTTWYRALRTALTQPADAARAAYREAARTLEGAGMPGLSEGLLPLALLSVDVLHGTTYGDGPDTEWGPYEPWVRPLLLADLGRIDEARTALRAAPEPPRDLLNEALWCVLGRAALAVGDRTTARLAHTHLRPAAAEQAGAGSGLLTFGPVERQLAELGGLLG
ncbi:AfsR/SARP family transcriptional regulator [Streptomyces luteolus]|uniref:BTAD domain-containing putative transcriptional regulator n=1 Tax=Streptomyces luteolus TaxID=3043615 RepID=A0ABT6T0Y9_9ACTN|nr:BTAD domain-containing putative transcriptional regulator [Streptomyces sp. B-S-A12]MDI3421532.1 BTAD domain-containing putative transcriptional regulator [Streptomyces sp. B-S-A12]